MKRRGEVHYFRSLHYLLTLACGDRQAAEAQRLRFSTEWEHVTCALCRERKPLTEEEEKLIGFSKGLAQHHPRS